MVPYPAELVKHLGRFAFTDDTVSSDALRTVLTPGSPGGGGGVGVTGGFTLPVTTCWTVLTVVRMVGPERGCSHARNWSRTLARIDRDVTRVTDMVEVERQPAAVRLRPGHRLLQILKRPSRVDIVRGAGRVKVGRRDRLSGGTIGAAVR